VEEFDFEQYPIKAAIMLDVIEHIENDNAIVKQVYDKLPNGAWFITTVPAYQSLWSRATTKFISTIADITGFEFNNLLRQAGFNIVYSSYFNTLLFAPSVLKRYVDKLTGAEKKNDERLKMFHH
jgi:2-polyprenyl-3-methyl-5-hydroxy-6-metoxy-1,4-benzoquinol methylase